MFSLGMRWLQEETKQQKNTRQRRVRVVHAGQHSMPALEIGMDVNCR